MRFISEGTDGGVRHFREALTFLRSAADQQNSSERERAEFAKLAQVHATLALAAATAIAARPNMALAERTGWDDVLGAVPEPE